MSDETNIRDAVLEHVAAGEAIVQRAEQYLRRDDRIERIRYRAQFPAPSPPPPQAADSAPLSVAGMLECITQAEARGRSILAALGLARLREFHEATNPTESWAEFSRKHVPLARDRVEELIGRMVHRNAVLRCTKCSTEVKCPCGCGVPFVSDHPWANADPLTRATALERAAEAVAAHPEKSNRAIAAEIGVGAQTVKRARDAAKAAAPDGAVDGAVDERTGRDGRRRKVPGKADYDRDEPEPGNYRVALCLRADAARELAFHSGPDAEIDEDCCKLAAEAAAAWALLERQLREIKK